MLEIDCSIEIYVLNFWTTFPQLSILIRVSKFQSLPPVFFPLDFSF